MIRLVEESSDLSHLSRSTKPSYYSPNFFYHSPQQHNVSQNNESIPNNKLQNTVLSNIKHLNLPEIITVPPLQLTDKNNSTTILQSCLNPSEQSLLDQPKHELSSESLTNTLPSLPSSPFVKCKLCWEEVPHESMFTLSHCQCSFCSKCLNEYVVLSIHEGHIHPIECPNPSCPFHATFQTHEIQELVSSDLFKKYKKLKFQNEIDLNPYESFCPSKHCDTVISLPREHFSKHHTFSSRPALCHRCGFKFCVLCKEAWHEGFSCVENLKQLQEHTSFDGIRYDESENALIKRCPFCFLPIERDGGCAQVKCKKCNHIFCWYCLTCLDRDALFFHYERGPCKNKLGHSRASIIWHRLQVVTIFAGVGLLVLLASPFLLLAAPCVVCCKFKSSRRHSTNRKKKMDTDVRLSTIIKVSDNVKDDTLVMLGIPDEVEVGNVDEDNGAEDEAVVGVSGGVAGVKGGGAGVKGDVVSVEGGVVSVDKGVVGVFGGVVEDVVAGMNVV